MISIGAHASGVDGHSTPSRQADGGNPHADWLRQMELAQLQAMHAASTAPDAPTAPAPSVPAAQTVEPRHRAASVNAPASAPEAAAVPPAPAPALAGAATELPIATALARPAAPAAFSHVMAGTLPRFAPLPTSVLAASVVPAPQPALPLQGTAPLAAVASDSNVALPTSDDNASARADLPQWQAQHMHLRTEDGDVQLWIRDAALQTQQTQQLLLRLAGDMASAGLRLKAATVNGKLAYTTAPDADAASAAFISHLKENPHGT